MTIRHLYPAVEPSLNLDFANSKRLDSRITFTRASTGTYLDPETQLITIAAANEARIEKEGLLIEESRTNAFSNSTFSSNNKQGTNIVETPNAFMAPDGTMTATRIQADNINYYNSQFPYSSAAGQYTVYSYWIYVNYAFRIRTRLSGYGVISTKDHIVEPGVWTRIFQRTAVVADATGLQLQPSIFRDSGSIDVYVWGFQLENGPFPTSYIPTSGSTVTRSADVASMTGTNFSSWYNSSEGTIVSNSVTAANAAFTYTINAGTGNNRLGLNIGTDYGQPFVTVSGTSSAYGTAPTLVAGGGLVAFRYKASDYAAYGDATALTGTNPTSVPTGLNELAIGFRGTYLPDTHLNGHISRLTYYPYRLTNAQLEALTL